MNNLSGKRKKGALKYGSKKKMPRNATWTHTFVCLADTTQDLVPNCDERAKLMMAGVGEKKIQLIVDSDAQDINCEISSQFPKLRNAGGFELLRAQEGGGKLFSAIVVPQAGYSVGYLKTVVHNAKIYIRPLQRDLSLEPDNDEVHVYAETNMLMVFIVYLC